MVRPDATDIDSFKHIVVASDGYGSVDMNFVDHKGSHGARFQFIRSVDKDQDFISNVIVSKTTSKIFAAVVVIDDRLSAFA